MFPLFGLQLLAKIFMLRSDWEISGKNIVSKAFAAKFELGTEHAIIVLNMYNDTFFLLQRGWRAAIKPVREPRP